MKPALLFYCQHSVGLGHLMRSYALAEALAERYRVVLLAGGELPDGHRPAAATSSSSRCRRWASSRATASAAATRATRPSAPGRSAPRASRRRSRDTQPQVVLVELFPFGRAKFARELVPLLEQARAHGRLHRLQPARHPRQRARQPARARRPRGRSSPTSTSTPCSCTATRASPAWRRPSSRATPLRVPVHYTGFVTAQRQRRPRSAASTSSSPPAAAASARRCSKQAMQAPARPPDARDRRPADARRGLRRGSQTLKPDNVELLRSVPDLAQELSQRRGPASASAATTPRSTSCARRVPALVVPYATPEEDEQTRRARRLQQLGAVQMADAPQRQPRRAAGLQPRAHRRSTSTARTRPASCCHERRRKVLRPYVLGSGARCSARAPSTAVVAARRAGQAVADGADRRPRDRQPRGAVRRSTWASCCAIGALILVIAVAESAAHVLLRPVDAERRASASPTSCASRLRPPAAAQPRLPPAHARRATCSPASPRTSTTWASCSATRSARCSSPRCSRSA